MERRSCSLRDAKALEQRIIQECKTRKTKWTDPDFGPDSQSLFRRDSSLDCDRWQRLTEMGHEVHVFVDGVSSGDIVQGELGDCWWLGAASVVATRNDLLFPLFVAAHPEYGFFQVRFYKNGAWRVVTIDDWVPTKYGQIRFGRCQDKTEIWVPLLEKGFAKLNGNYENCSSGHFGEGMTDLTGEGCETFDLKTVDREQFWQTLKYFSEEAFLMGCSVPLTGDSQIESDNGRGLLLGHAYAILKVVETSRRERLLQCRNPWGNKEWTGAWSDGSSEWTPQMRAELGHAESDDGVFYISYSDFLVNFSEFCVCRLLQDEIGTVWEKRVFFGEWDKERAGGCGNTVGWKQNDQYWVKITGGESVRMFFHLAQEDVRSQFKPSIEYSIGLYLMTHESSMTKKTARTKQETLHTPSFINRREYAFSIDLPPGTYVLVPCTFDPGQLARFYLTVYSEHRCEAGKVGHGSAPKEHVAKFDMADLAWMNTGGVVKRDAASGSRSPRRDFAPSSPRRRGPVSPRGPAPVARPSASPASSGKTTHLSVQSAAAPITRTAVTRPSDEMLLEAIGTMSSVVDDIVDELRDPELSQMGRDAIQQKLGFFRRKHVEIGVKCETPEERRALADIDAKLAAADRLLSPSSVAAAPVAAPAAAKVRVPQIAVVTPVSRPVATTSTSSSSGSVKTMSVAQLTSHLRTSLSLTEASLARLESEGVDGAAFVLLTEADCKESLGMPLGDRKKVAQYIAHLLK